jgi:2'-5' RNA ligase
MTGAPAPIIVSALLAEPEQSRLEALRKAHFPPERNVLAAHLTLFHHLPPSLGSELDTALDRLTRNQTAPAARIDGFINLGRGVAVRVRSEQLDRVRAELAEMFAAVLIPQDQASWRAHVTLQNKVTPDEARALLRRLEAEHVPSATRVVALASWFYRDGPWELRRRHRFAG